MLNGNILDEIRELPNNQKHRIALEFVEKRLANKRITTDHELDI